MLTLNLSHLFYLSPEHGVSEEELKAEEVNLASFLEKIEDRDQGFYTVIDDQSVVEDIEAFAKKVSGNFDDIVILGIGGSALGSITLRDALVRKDHSPRLHVLENIDPDFMHEVEQSLNLERTLFLPITKSGGTPETLAQYFYFRQKVENSGLAAKDHFVFITGSAGLLRETAKAEDIPIFAIPENVGGRFSVLTPVGLLPAALVGIDIRALLRGAQNMRDKFLSPTMEENLPFQLAALQALLHRKGKTQNVIMPYVMALRTFAGWFVQLLAESTGKVDQQGKNTGLTPIASVGVTDQHSQLQLFVEGPNDKLILFLTVQQFEQKLEIPVLQETDKTSFLHDRTFQQLLQAEQKATADALSEANRPSLTIELDRLSPENLGELFLLFEGATAFLGEYLNINAFDQPGVERSKILTRKYLEK